MIAEGPTDSDSNRARKAHVRLMETLSINEDKVAREAPSISFGLEDLTRVALSHSDALVILATIANYKVARVLVDSRSSVNVLF